MTIERRSFLSGVIASIGAGMVKIATPEETSAFAKGMEVTTVRAPEITKPIGIVDPNLYIHTRTGYVSVGWMQQIRTNAPVDGIITCDILAVPDDIGAIYEAFETHVHHRPRANARQKEALQRAYNVHRKY